MKQKCSKETAELSKQLKTSKAPISNLLRKYRSTLKINKNKLHKLRKAKLSSMLSSSGTTSSSHGILPQPQGLVHSSNEDSKSTATSSKLKRLHPSCQITRPEEEIKDESSPVKQQTSKETTKPLKQLNISSNSITTDDLEDKKENLLETSIETDLRDKTKSRDKQNREENVMSNESKTEEEKANEKKSITQQKTNIKYTERKIYQPSINKKRILSITEEENYYPWQKNAAKNREKKSPLSEKIEKINGCVNKILKPIMKSHLYENIDYTDSVNMKIFNKLEKLGGNYICINCNTNPPFSTKRRDTAIKHIKTELGCYMYRCSFCDFKANDPRIVINHYAATHGIPREWLKSN